MKVFIRPYHPNDYGMICSWWGEFGQDVPTPGMLLEDGTFILDLDGTSSLCLTVLLTQSKDMSYLFAYIKNPLYCGCLEEYGKQLWDHCFDYAASKGYSRIICFADNPKLEAMYKRFGMIETTKNMTGLIKELPCR